MNLFLRFAVPATAAAILSAWGFEHVWRPPILLWLAVCAVNFVLLWPLLRARRAVASWAKEHAYHGVYAVSTVAAWALAAIASALFAFSLFVAMLLAPYYFLEIHFDQGKCESIVAMIAAHELPEEVPGVFKLPPAFAALTVDGYVTVTHVGSGDVYWFKTLDLRLFKGYAYSAVPPERLLTDPDDMGHYEIDLIMLYPEPENGNPIPPRRVSAFIEKTGQPGWFRIHGGD